MRKLIKFLAFSILLASLGCTSAPREADTRPNIIIIMTDDQPYYTIDKMPTLSEEITSKGIKFTNAYFTTPLCCPSRASILTGQYAHNHGVRSNQPPLGGAAKFKDGDTIATEFKNAGYKTAYIGKYLNYYKSLSPLGYVPPGWEYWFSFLNIEVIQDYGYYYNLATSEQGFVDHNNTEYGTSITTDKAVEFISQYPEYPFLLYVSYFSPHTPYLPEEKYSQSFSPGDLTYLPNFNEEDISDKPSWMMNYEPVNPAKAEEAKLALLRSLMSVDEGIGKILQELEKNNIRDNTVILFLTDNGISMGEHRLFKDKRFPYEENIKIPLLISYPKLITAPREENRFVLNIDIAPTLYEIAGIPIPSSVDGESFLPLILGTAVKWRTFFLAEHWAEPAGSDPTPQQFSPTFNLIRDQNWKYIEYVTGEIELYDLDIDPYELNNLAKKNKFQELIQTLKFKLDAMIDFTTR